MRRTLLLPVLLAMLAVPGDRAAVRDDPRAPIHARAIPLDQDAPRRVRVGALIYRGGWVLRGDNPDFGGLSSMTIVGDRVTGLSDAGVLLAFTFRDGRASDPLVTPLPTLGSTRRKRERDTESMTRDPASGRLWVGTEFTNMIWRFAPGFARAEAAAAPAAMHRWPENGGPESIARLADGRFLVIAETAHGAGDTREALLFAGDPTRTRTPPPLRFLYRPPAGTNPSDATELPDGRIAVLNRHASWRDGFAAVLTAIDPAAIRPGAAIGGVVLARLAPPLAIDNMEALAITREHGRTMIWMASDDNFIVVQRTLLLKFELAG